jgi:hypothetical protein
MTKAIGELQVFDLTESKALMVYCSLDGLYCSPALPQTTKCNFFAATDSKVRCTFDVKHSTWFNDGYLFLPRPADNHHAVYTLFVRSRNGRVTLLTILEPLQELHYETSTAGTASKITLSVSSNLTDGAARL